MAVSRALFKHQLSKTFKDSSQLLTLFVTNISVDISDTYCSRNLTDYVNIITEKITIPTNI